MPPPWWSVPVPDPAARLRLLCFPYAGGSAAAYRPWAAQLPVGVELATVLLPGREARLAEPAVCDMAELVAALLANLRPAVDGRPYALFGHSMGATVAYEFCRALVAAGGPAPTALLVSGAPAPQLRRRPRTHGYADGELTQLLRRRRDIPTELLTPELLQLVLPTLRTDLMLLDRYSHRPGVPLAVPIFAYAGTEDLEVTLAEVAAWERCTTGPTQVQAVPGDHFFIADGSFRGRLGHVLSGL